MCIRDRLEIGFALRSGLEHDLKLSYDWLYRFDYKQKLENQHHRDKQTFDFDWTTHYRITEFHEILQIIELLDRDDNYFVANQNILAAKENHGFCQICAFEPEHMQKHSHKEPEIWEQVNIIPSMESAIVLSTKAVEVILGKPGDRSNKRKIQRLKERWTDAIDLNPDEEFELAKMSYLDYYCLLYTSPSPRDATLSRMPSSA